MCHPACLQFVKQSLSADDVAGRRVIEVGSFDASGHPRRDIEALRPTEYLGVDIRKGPGVDTLCKAEDLVDQLGNESADLVIALDLLEHVEDWRVMLSNLKQICRPDGVIVITARSPGSPYQGSPRDYWRFGIEDLRSSIMSTHFPQLHKRHERIY